MDVIQNHNFAGVSKGHSRVLAPVVVQHLQLQDVLCLLARHNWDKNVPFTPRQPSKTEKRGSPVLDAMHGLLGRARDPIHRDDPILRLHDLFGIPLLKRSRIAVSGSTQWRSTAGASQR